MPGDQREPGMPPIPPTPDQANRDVLSFKEFSSRYASNYPRYGNFWTFFAGGEYADQRRTQPFYQKFLAEHPNVAALLFEKIENQRNKQGSTSNSLRPFDQDLYEAYKIMKSYGVSDRELFA